MQEQPIPHVLKPSVIGLYGVPGTGKTTLLPQLKDQLGEKEYAFYDGAIFIESLVPGGPDKFRKMPDEEKNQARRQAINKIRADSVESGKTSIIAGHGLLWPEYKESGEWVVTAADWQTYTHIIYLDAPADVIARRWKTDTTRTRGPVSENHIAKWQAEEKRRLREGCYKHGVLFAVLAVKDQDPRLLLHVENLIADFKDHTEEKNMAVAEKRLVDVVQGRSLERMLVFDGDRTLASEDTGSMFWKKLRAETEDPLEALFSSAMGYSYTAFRQAAVLYNEVMCECEGGIFDSLCERVAKNVKVHPEFKSMLDLAGRQDHVGAVVVTCGQGLIWEKVLELAGLSDKVKVIGGGLLEDGFVVTADVKAALVAKLQDQYQISVVAFGDSPLDLGMLEQADEAVVIVGAKQGRSSTMDAKLQNAIDHQGLKARQMLLPPGTATPRLSTEKLPLIHPGEIESLINSPPILLHATDKGAAKLLMTPMRDANVFGPALRDAHFRVGRHLAIEYLSDLIGLETDEIPHVTGGSTDGHRLLHESKTLIVPLMRGGEPMAFGVSDAFPTARWKHASEAMDLTEKKDNLKGVLTVILVDSVINTGASIKPFVELIGAYDPSIRIVVVTGVVQAEACGPLRRLARRHGKLSVVALRVSNTKFVGRGSTDTGHRLFNTTHLD